MSFEETRIQEEEQQQQKTSCTSSWRWGWRRRRRSTSEKAIKRRCRGVCTILCTLWVVTPGEDTWLIDSGASKHMSGKNKILSKLEEKNSPQKVSLGDDYQYPIKWIGEARYKLEENNSIKTWRK